MDFSKDNLRIGTFASRQIGDTLMATPLYQALRIRFPKAHLTLVSSWIPHPVLEGLSIFDEIIPYSPELQFESRFDVFILPVFCGDHTVEAHFNRSNITLSLAHSYEQRRKGLRNKWDGFYNHMLFYKHQVELNRELMELTGYQGEMPPLYCPQGDSQKVVGWKDYVGLSINTPITPFQKLPNRQWPMDHWKRLIQLLGSEKIILVGGKTDEPNLQALAKDSGLPYVATSTLAEFSALCKNLKVLVTTDGGTMHVAATTGVPIISLHGASSPILLHPWIYPHGRCISILSENLCSPCQRSYQIQLAELGLAEMTCMQNLKPETVLKAIETIATLSPGSCLIFQGEKIQTKKVYLKDCLRKTSWFVGYNVARLKLKFLRGAAACASY